MLSSLAYTLLFGKPLIMYGGIMTILCFAATAYVGHTILKGKPVLPMVWHMRLAMLSFALAFVHMLFGLSVYFGF